jgi:hypothetical protein
VLGRSVFLRDCSVCDFAKNPNVCDGDFTHMWVLSDRIFLTVRTLHKILSRVMRIFNLNVFIPHTFEIDYMYFGESDKMQ